MNSPYNADCLKTCFYLFFYVTLQRKKWSTARVVLWQTRSRSRNVWNFQLLFDRKMWKMPDDSFICASSTVKKVLRSTKTFHELKQLSLFVKKKPQLCKFNTFFFSELFWNLSLQVFSSFMKFLSRWCHEKMRGKVQNITLLSFLTTREVYFLKTFTVKNNLFVVIKTAHAPAAEGLNGNVSCWNELFVKSYESKRKLLFTTFSDSCDIFARYLPWTTIFQFKFSSSRSLKSLES